MDGKENKRKKRRNWRKTRKEKQSKTRLENKGEGKEKRLKDDH